MITYSSRETSNYGNLQCLKLYSEQKLASKTMRQLITGLANNHSHSHLQLKSKELLIACLWTVGGNWRTQIEPTQIQGETPCFCVTPLSVTHGSQGCCQVIKKWIEDLKVLGFLKPDILHLFRVIQWHEKVWIKISTFTVVEDKIIFQNVSYSWHIPFIF